MNQIPKIIHQIWSGVDEPLPEHFKLLGDTWKEDYPSWKYIEWDNKMMESFVQEHYPHYWKAYKDFQYNVQRWDAIRYLILDKIGGMYVDYDYESIIPLDALLIDKSCCFAMEPQSHCHLFNKSVMFNNAMMACVPGHFFMKKIVEKVFSDEVVYYKNARKDICVWQTTGPWNLIELYEQATPEEKEKIYLIPDKFVTPFDVMQARRFRMGEMSSELEDCLNEAYAMHYFYNGWLQNEK